MSFSVPGEAPLSPAHRLFNLPGAVSPWVRRTPHPIYIYFILLFLYYILLYLIIILLFLYHYILLYIFIFILNTHTRTHTHTHKCITQTHFLINFIYFNLKKKLQLFIHLSLRSHHLAISLSRASCKSRDIFVALSLAR